MSTQIFLLERTDGKGWNLPGGRVEAGETPEQAVVREVLEETGLTVEIVHDHRVPFDKVDDNSTLLDTAQLFFCKIVGGALVKTEEVRSYGWFGKSELPELVKVPCPGYPDGRTRAMTLKALQHADSSIDDAFFSESDPSLSADYCQCIHRNLEVLS